jgi:two-component system alkaline phosphatase synthesis response regulator PhoP
MPSLIIIAVENEEIKRLVRELSPAGFDFRLVPASEAEPALTATIPDLILWQPEASGRIDTMLKLLRETVGDRKIPIIALLARQRLPDFPPDLPVADFIVSPYEGKELLLRIGRQLGVGRAATGQIKAGDLYIDSSKAEVIIRGRRVDLTYREYELLRFLSANPGHVFSREALLNRVWGYDYYGGDRTVDVHVRRLRSKIETDQLTFIETVRNIGYRFRDNLGATII